MMSAIRVVRPVQNYAIECLLIFAREMRWASADLFGYLPIAVGGGVG